LKARPFLAVGSKQRIRPLTTVGRTSASGHELPVGKQLSLRPFNLGLPRYRPFNRSHQLSPSELRQCKSCQGLKLTLNNHSGPARRDHQHAILLAQNFVVEINTDDSVGTEFACLF